MTLATVAPTTDQQFATPNVDGDTTQSTEVGAQATRMSFIDALRGFAAVSVLLHHLLTYTPLQPALERALPTVLKTWCNLGTNGVEIFFVLSGFVIAYSVRHFRPTIQYAAKFVLKRQLRLDPPYWAAILLVLAVDFLMRTLLHFQPKAPPTLGWLISNFFYVYKFTGNPTAVGIVTPAWTLCLEVQFYLFFICLMLLGSVRSLKSVGSQWLIYCTGIISLLVTPGAYADACSPLFFDNWFYFAIGVLCYRAFVDSSKNWMLWSALSLLLIECVLHHGNNQMIVGLSTALLLVISGRTGFIYSGLNHPVFQFLGRISYSLYLVHAIVGPTVLRIGYKITKDSELMALGWFVIGLAVSIVAAYVFYKVVEVPSLKFAKSVNV